MICIPAAEPARHGRIKYLCQALIGYIARSMMMTSKFLAALVLAASLLTPLLAYAEGPQERALDKALQGQEQNNDSAPALAAQQAVSPTTALTGDDPSPKTVASPKVGSAVEGPEEQSLDSSLMQYRMQQDRDANAPPADAAQ